MLVKPQAGISKIKHTILQELVKQKESSWRCNLPVRTRFFFAVAGNGGVAEFCFDEGFDDLASFSFFWIEKGGLVDVLLILESKWNETE